MSYSMFEPESEQEPICECVYDEANDRTICDDCVIHRHEEETEAVQTELGITQKKPAAVDRQRKEDAA